MYPQLFSARQLPQYLEDFVVNVRFPLHDKQNQTCSLQDRNCAIYSIVSANDYRGTLPWFLTGVP